MGCAAAPAPAGGRPLGGRVHLAWTTRADGDARPSGPDGVRRLARAAGRPVAWADQVHGSGVLRVEAPGPAGAGDALVTDRPGLALAVFTADCAPVALRGTRVGGAPVVGLVHAGWRGLLAGVLEAAVAECEALGARHVVGALGPCIRPGCYAFDAADLEPVVARLGPGVAAVTAAGGSALDLPAAVAAGLARAGARLVADDGRCTACEIETCFSHRARADRARHATLVWGAGG